MPVLGAVNSKMGLADASWHAYKQSAAQDAGAPTEVSPEKA